MGQRQGRRVSERRNFLDSVEGGDRRSLNPRLSNWYRGIKRRRHLGKDVLTPSMPARVGPYDTFIAGLVGGYIVFGGRSPRSGKISSVNQQIVIYVFARVVLATARLAVKPGIGLPLVSTPKLSEQISYHAWPLFAALSWAFVMFLFRYHPDDLQPSLKSSMSYIYQQSDHWDSLRTLIWHNK